MKIEIILLLVIGLIFFIDTIMRGIKKKTSSSEVDIKEENFQDFKNTNNTPQKKWDNINVLKYIFDKELFLFVPSIIIVLFIEWYFNYKIKAR